MQWGSLNKFVGPNHFTLLALQLNTWGYFGPTLDSLSSSGHFHLPSHPRSHSGFLLPVSHPSPCTCLTASGPSTQRTHTLLLRHWISLSLFLNASKSLTFLPLLCPALRSVLSPTNAVALAPNWPSSHPFFYSLLPGLSKTQISFCHFPVLKKSFDSPKELNLFSMAHGASNKVVPASHSPPLSSAHTPCLYPHQSLPLLRSIK